MGLSSYRGNVPAIAALILASGPAASQQLPDNLQNLTSSDAIANTASALIDQGADRLLLKDLLGKEIKGSDGNTIGTVRDFVVLPGGRLVAAIVETDDGTWIAIPFGAVKVASSADTVGLEVPVEASEVQNMDELRELAQELSSN